MTNFSSRKPSATPKELAKSGRALWKALLDTYSIDDPGGLAHLLTACRCEDDIQRMRATVAKDGDTVADRFGQLNSHPLLAAIRGAETVKRQAIRALNLDLEPLQERPGRPSGR